MRVACLMAGKSTRLLPLTRRDHKAMLKIGDLRVVDAQLQTFALAGLNAFSFVIGHGGRRLAAHLLAKYSGLAISIINNNHFDVRNLDWSVHLALSAEPGPVIYYEGDLIVSPSILRQIANYEVDVCLAMDEIGQSAQIDTRIIADGDRVRELIFSDHGHVQRNSNESANECVCLVKLSDRARMYVIQRLAKMPFTGPVQVYEIFNSLFKRYPSFLVRTAGRPWVEIDNKADLHRASQILCRILRLKSDVPHRERTHPPHGTESH
jgi:choline kinase